MKTLRTMLVLLVALPGFAQEVSILDLNTDGIPANSYTYLEPHAPTFDGRLPFRTDVDDGEELWFTQGSTGTPFFEDLWFGLESSRPGDFTMVGSRLFFVATNPGTGSELWSTLGPGQTAMVADLVPGPLNSGVQSLSGFGDDLFFTASDSVNRGLYTVDSVSLVLAPVATDVVAPINHTEIVDDGSRVYFKGRPPSGGSSEIWTSDGTSGGTEPATDAACSAWGELLGAGGLVFAVCDEGTSTKLLRLQPGSPDGTLLVHDFGNQTVDRLTPAGGTLYMVVGDEEIWGLDSTTGMASQITGFGGGASPDDLLRYQGNLLFTATAANGREVFSTNGSTVTEIDVFPGQPGSDPTDLRVHDGRVYFTADDGTNGRELWSTDGTAADTSIVLDLEPGTSDSEIGIGPSTDFGLVFNRADRGLWITDGTAAGTAEFPLPGSKSSSPTNLHLDSGSGKLFFVRDRGIDDGGQEPFVTDGTVDGTLPLGDLEPGPEGSEVEFEASLPNGRTLFTAYTTADDFQLWSTQGLESDAEIVQVINPDGIDQGLYGEVFDGSYFFCADDGVNGLELWRSDGTAAGTFMLADLNPSGDADPCDFAVFEGHLYFGAEDGIDGGLWRTDGTATGTELVAVTAPGSNRQPGNLVVSGAFLYFAADDDGAARNEIWRSDGTAAGTELVADINPGSQGSHPRDLVPAVGLLFFSADDGVHGRELWRTDGTAAGTVLVGDMLSGPEDSDARPVAELAGGLVFNVRWPDNALYFTDGTPGAIIPIMQADFISIGPYSPVWNGHIYFIAAGENEGNDLWRTDGTPAGTVNLQLEPGDQGSEPRDLVAGPEHLYLTAYDLVAKREIHILTKPLFADGFESGDTSAW